MIYKNITGFAKNMTPSIALSLVSISETVTMSWAGDAD